MLLGPVDPVPRGPCRAVVLEGVDVGVIGGHGRQFYWSRAGKATQGMGRVLMSLGEKNKSPTPAGVKLVVEKMLNWKLTLAFVHVRSRIS